MIPVNEPLLGGRELEYVTECVRTGWVSSAGRFIDAFEEGWARYCGRRFGIAMSSGTAALDAAAQCLGLGPGDEVILPTFTIISCILPVIRTGATPVLVDSDPRTWTLDPNQVKDRITPRTKAIIVVHIYGHPADMDPILEIADRHGVAVIEDAAEAHGAEYEHGHGSAGATWRRCGGFGRLSCFSFYANKPVTTGEGGMVLTDDPRTAQRARTWRNLGFGAGRHRFCHEELGFNYRMTNLQAAVGLAQLERMDQIVAKKRWIGAEYTRRLAGTRSLELQEQRPWARSVYWMYGVVLSEDSRYDAASGADQLARRGIETRPFFLGMHEQPVFRKRGWFGDASYPIAERLARRGLYLPSGLTLTEEQIDTVVAAVREVL